MKLALLLGVAGALLGGAGCIGTTPNDAARARLGPEPGRHPSPEHRPGQPCLVCHSSEGGNEPRFIIAGTMFGPDAVPTTDSYCWLERPEATAPAGAKECAGRRGISVHMTDAMGREFTATTNSAGNFMVTTQGDGEERGGEGMLSLAFEPQFPIAVDTSDGDDDRGMRSPIVREGSCAFCHGAKLGSNSAGPAVIGTPPP